MLTAKHRELFITNAKGNELFVDQYFLSPESPNLIFCCTPIVTVTDFEVCYKPFAEKGFNVFALDFAGVGKSAGSMKNFSARGIVEDFDALLSHICNNYGKYVFLFGDTGTGGIFAQHYAAVRNDVTALAQYGICIPGDTSPLKSSAGLLRIMHGMLSLSGKLLPQIQLPFTVPAYDGYNAERDNRFYARLREENPAMFRVHVNFMTTLMGMFLGKNGVTEKDIAVPTLVFKTLHDRYYPPEYFDKYYARLNCAKRLVEINDVHNSYYFYPERIAADVADWFMRHM